ncbi:MAG TPA: hypothetical protein VGW74_10575 [Propionibacteriaceae bacterium]|nr:hypothetical protein [Propionibacteriaceae bacterium]
MTDRCPHVRTSPGGTSFCSLAEATLRVPGEPTPWPDMAVRDGPAGGSITYRGVALWWPYLDVDFHEAGDWAPDPADADAWAEAWEEDVRSFLHCLLRAGHGSWGRLLVTMADVVRIESERFEQAPTLDGWQDDPELRGRVADALRVCLADLEGDDR